MSSSLILSQRDHEALKWVGEQYACPADQLAVILGRSAQRAPLTIPATWSVVRRWEAGGLVRRQRFLAGPSWVWLTRAGLRQTGLNFTASEPKRWMLAHIGAVNRVRFLLEAKRPESRWHPERQIRAATTAKGTLVPDAEVHDPNGKVIAIEVELSIKSVARRRQIMQNLVDRYDAVWYFATAECWAAVHDAACHAATSWQDQIGIYALEDV